MYNTIKKYADDHHVTLVAVSKTKPNEEILRLYNEGQRIFGENKVQELVEKYEPLPKDIQWHLIGHLQKNKVKYIAAFVSMIHSVDSQPLLKTIDKEAAKHHRIIPVLLQFHIATEDTKFGLDLPEAHEILDDLKKNPLPNVQIWGVMGMATFTNDVRVIKKEFKSLKAIFDTIKEQHGSALPYFKEISMGMSGDYGIAIDEGSTMIRIGSAIFGER
ncbi:MAG: YggS family pyridoxal phosphate-dependent enzyme [Saprospiraceae bacterium]